MGSSPTIHEINARSLSQVQGYTSSLETDEEYSDMDVIHCDHDSVRGANDPQNCTEQLTKMLDRRVSSLRGHRSLQATNLKRRVLSVDPQTIDGFMHTLKPALFNLNAIKSKKFTNWLKTRLFVVASSRRRFVSSSTRASIFVDDRHLSTSRRPRMPWRVLFTTSSSTSSAGASKSIVRGRKQTGHSGCHEIYL